MVRRAKGVAVLRRDPVLVGVAAGIWLAVAAGLLVLAALLAHHTFAFPLVAKCDQDRNSVINSADLGFIAQGWGTTSGDVDLNGVTNSADLGLCAREFGKWAYPDGTNPDDSVELRTVTTEGLSLEEQATATAIAGICPECVPAPTSAVPTP